MIAAEVMSRPVVSVRPTMPVRQAMVMLVEHRFGALPVVNEEERLLGMVSESDVLRSGMTGASIGTTVAEVMAAPLATVPMSATVTELAEILLDRRLRCVPVIDNNILVGVVSRSDLLRTLLQDDDVLADRIRRLLNAYAGRRPRWSVEVDGGRAWISGPFADEAERRVVIALAHTVPGIGEVDLRPTLATI